MKIIISKLCIILLSIMYLHATIPNEINLKKGIQNIKKPFDR